MKHNFALSLSNHLCQNPRPVCMYFHASFYQGLITVLILLVYAIHPPFNLFYSMPSLNPTQSTNNPSDASWSKSLTLQSHTIPIWTKPTHIISQFHILIQDIILIHIHTHSSQTLPIKKPSPNPILLSPHTPTKTTHIPKSFSTKLSTINPQPNSMPPHPYQCLSPIQMDWIFVGSQRMC